MQYLLTQGTDYISDYLKKGIRWEGFLLDVLSIYLQRKENPVFLDIGANLGAVSIPIGKLLQSKQGKVYSIEAQRSVFYQLCGNIFANNLTNNCIAYHTALGDRIGEIEIPVLDINNTPNVGALSLDPEIRKNQSYWDEQQFQQYETTPMTTLDMLSLPPAHIIKIDVEGMELEVLKGSVRWLKNSDYPPILFEVWSEEVVKNCTEKNEQLFQFLHEMGYETYVYQDIGFAQYKDKPCFRFELNAETQVFTVHLVEP